MEGDDVRSYRWGQDEVHPVDHRMTRPHQAAKQLALAMIAAVLLVPIVLKRTPGRQRKAASAAAGAPAAADA